jgi:hypothetical protein
MLPVLEPRRTNLEELLSKIQSLISPDWAPLLFLDLDDTLNHGFGLDIAKEAVPALAKLYQSRMLFGLNTGANIAWAGMRVFRQTDGQLKFPLNILDNGQQIYAWHSGTQAYVRLPLVASNKGQAMEKLASFLEIPLGQMGVVADFPRGSKKQAGIDDAILDYPVGWIINVGENELGSAQPGTWLARSEDPGRKFGVTATVEFIENLAAMIEKNNLADWIRSSYYRLLHRIEAKLKLPVLESENHCVWTIEKPFEFADHDRPLLIRAKSPGMLHAGVNRHGLWIRIYDIPLQRTERNIWEAEILDPHVNDFTFIWYDRTGNMAPCWEGKNYYIHRGCSS